LEGQVDQIPDAQNFAWITKQEAAKFLDKETYRDMKDFL
jgi:hypothetical protein